MQLSVRARVPAAAVLGLLCRGCLNRARNLPSSKFSTLHRQMSRWNSQETCSPPPPQDNPRVLITGDTNISNLILTFVFRKKQTFLQLPKH